MIKKCIGNLKANLLFLLSCTGWMGLALGTEMGILKVSFFAAAIAAVLCLFSPFSVQEKKNFSQNGKAIILAGVIEFVYLLSFYKRFTLVILQKIAMMIHIPAQWLFLALGLFLCGVGFYAIYVLSSKLISALSPFFAMVYQYRKQLVLLSGLFCLSLTALIRVNFTYADDLGRVDSGGQLTGDFSRFIASILSVFVHSNYYLTDISPVPQLLAACILAVSCVALYAIMTDNGEMNRWGVIAMLPVGVFPLFLQCYSYKFDAPYMALSFLFSVIPLIYRSKGQIQFGVASFVGTVLMCMTYQASSGILPMIVVALLVKLWSQKASIQKMVSVVLPAALGYILGMLMFRLFFMDTIEDSYVDAAFSINAIVPNLIMIFRTLLNRLTPIWIILMLAIIFGYVRSLVFSAKRGKWSTLGVAIGGIIAMLILFCGVYIILEQPSLSPRAMYGLSIPIAVGCIQISQSGKQFLGKTAILLLSMSFFVFSFTYGNALQEQKDYTASRLQLVLSDIADADAVNSGGKVSVQVVGTVGRPGQLKGTIEEYPLLEEIVPVQLSASEWYWGDYQLLHYTGLEDILVPAESDLEALNLPIIVDNIYHTIKGDGEHLLIVLK